MKSIISATDKVFAEITFYAASLGAGLASFFWYHQPKVPEKFKR